MKMCTLPIENHHNIPKIIRKNAHAYLTPDILACTAANIQGMAYNMIEPQYPTVLNQKRAKSGNPAMYIIQAINSTNDTIR